MQCQQTDPVNHGKVMSSQEQTVTLLSTRVGRDLGSPDQTVTQSGFMRPGKPRRKTRSTKDNKYNDFICE